VTFCPVTFCPFTQINTIAYNNFSFILGIFTRESYSPEQSAHNILKADVIPFYVQHLIAINILKL
jgi:hypothetical protein